MFTLMLTHVITHVYSHAYTTIYTHVYTLFAQMFTLMFTLYSQDNIHYYMFTLKFKDMLQLFQICLILCSHTCVIMSVYTHV